MKPGDMVVLVDIDETSSSYEIGLRKGAIGTIIRPYSGNWSNCDWDVDFSPISSQIGAPSRHLRKIDPPEAADGWKHCVFKPKVKELETI